MPAGEVSRPDHHVGRVLTAINLAMPVLVLAVFLALGISHAVVLDRVAPVVFWLWLAATPVVGVLAIRRARRDKARHLLRLNIVALVLCALFLLGTLLLH